MDPTNDPTVQTLVQEPSISLIKTVTGTGISTPVQDGDTITYGLTIRNN